MYSSTELASLLNITPQTVRSRSEEFAAYLSHVANPGEGRQRQYTDDDARVMALINEMNKAGARVSDIHTALKTGKRGELPEKAPSDLAAAPNKQISAMREAMVVLQEENRRLQSALDEQRGRDKLLEEKLAAAEAEIKALNREIGRLEASKGSE